MARRKVGQEHIRNIQKTSGSYLVWLPISIVRAMGWKERQRVVVKKYGGNRVIIMDWAK